MDVDASRVERVVVVAAAVVVSIVSVTGFAAAVIVARCTILYIGVFHTRIVHDIALEAVDASRVERAGVVATIFVVSVVSVTGCAAAIGVVGVIVRCLVPNVIVASVVVIAGNLCLLWPRGRACIALTCALDFFWLCVVIWFGFCGFRWFGRCGSD